MQEKKMLSYSKVRGLQLQKRNLASDKWYFWLIDKQSSCVQRWVMMNSSYKGTNGLFQINEILFKSYVNYSAFLHLFLLWNRFQIDHCSMINKFDLFVFTNYSCLEQVSSKLRWWSAANPIWWSNSNVVRIMDDSNQDSNLLVA